MALAGCSTGIGERITSWLPDWELPSFGRRPALTEPMPTPPPRRPLVVPPAAAAATPGALPAPNALALANPQERPRETLAGGAAPPVMTAQNAPVPAPAVQQSTPLAVLQQMAQGQALPPPPAAAPLPPPPPALTAPAAAAAAAAPVPPTPAPVQTPAPAPVAPPAPAVAAPAPIVPPAPQPAPATPRAAVAAPAPALAPLPRNVLAAEAADDNTVVGRMRRVEAGLAQMQQEFAGLRPSIERLVAIEADLDELVAQLFTVITREPATAEAAPRPATPPATTTRPGAPVALLPAQPARPPAATAPAATTPAPAATAPRPAAPVATAPPPAPAGAFALHLASYRAVATAREGWDELSRAAPQSALAGLAPGTAVFDKPGEGRYVRLNAGPVANRGDAEARCRTLQNAGLYCAVLPYAGTSPF